MKVELKKLLIFFMFFIIIPSFSKKLEYLGMRGDMQNNVLSFGANDYVLNYETPYRLLIFF